MNNFGTLVKKIREEKGISIEQLEKKGAFPQPGYVAAIEEGTLIPEYPYFLALALSLGIQPLHSKEEDDKYWNPLFREWDILAQDGRGSHEPLTS
mgnify:CR=1 FL=1